MAVAPAKLAPKPAWIRAKMPTGEVFFDLRRRVNELGLHTVCESASCPNIGECWNRQSLTIMILGVHAIGHGVTDLIAEISVAMTSEATIHDIMAAVHPHPTLSEVVLEAAAEALGEGFHM